MNASSIRNLLRAHLDGAGTANDSTTEELYRLAHGLPEDADTELELVERWAFRTINGGAPVFGEPANEEFEPRDYNDADGVQTMGDFR